MVIPAVFGKIDTF